MGIHEVVEALGNKRYLEGAETVEHKLARLFAEEIREASIRIARSPQTMRVVEAFDNSLKLQWETIEGTGIIDLFISELESVGTIEKHGKNVYHILWRLPVAPHSASELVALQTVPTETKGNGEHWHAKENRIEVIRVLKGKLLVKFHDGDDRNRITGEMILVPGSSIVISPWQYHSVENIGDEPVRALILGAQLEA